MNRTRMSCTTSGGEEAAQTEDDAHKQRNHPENENDLGGPTFVPPLFQQRYCFVQNILTQKKCKHVVDFGCAECTIIRSLVDVPSLEKIQLVDLDQPLLTSNKYRIKPWIYDYLHKRDQPLTVEIFCGSATDADQRLLGCDAVTMVEFIEHLYQGDLEEVLQTTFSCLKPKYVIMTTPNFDFNQLFPDPSRFRHYDHKFEWTRLQFQEWCLKICNDYSYDVEFSGVGNPPKDAVHYGYCSQAAIFTKCSEVNTDVKDVSQQSYELIAKADYPYKEETELDSDIIFSENLVYAINFLTRKQRLSLEEEEIDLPICEIMKFPGISDLCHSNKDILRAQLVKNGYNVKNNYVVIQIEDNDNKDEHLDDFEDYTEDNDQSDGECKGFTNVPEVWE